MRQEPEKEFDGRVLNPSGVEIEVPFWVFLRLKKLHLLKRDRKTGKRRVSVDVYRIMEIWEGPEFRTDRGLRALPLGRRSGRPQHGGHANLFLKTLGRDCSGPV